MTTEALATADAAPAELMAEEQQAQAQQQHAAAKAAAKKAKKQKQKAQKQLKAQQPVQEDVMPPAQVLPSVRLLLLTLAGKTTQAILSQPAKQSAIQRGIWVQKAHRLRPWLMGEGGSDTIPASW